MAFNKARVLHEAENLANQGKISQAIKRYFDIIEKDPSEVILLNTIGDLYIRDRNVSEGLKQFYKLAEAYVQDGFTLKAIAIYKKIVKLDPDSVDPLLKLAELYQAQRLVREARDLFYQAAEYYKKKQQNDQALEALRKVVELDVENATARARLAAFCEELGRKEEASQVYRETAQLALGRGDTGAARTALKKAQELNPDDPQVQLLRAREALALKHPEEVEAILSATPGLMEDPARRSLLIDSYFAMHQAEKAETLVLDLFRANPVDFSPLASFVSVCVQGGQFDPAAKALSTVAEQLVEQGNTSSLMESLRLIWSKSPHHLPTLDLILRICDKRGDEGELAKTLEALGHAYLQCGQFEKAEQSFRRLVSCDPANERYQALLRQVLQKQGKEFGETQVGDRPVSATALPRGAGVAAPAASPLRLVDREAIVKEALENSELLVRYHLVSKAVAELEKVLEVFPDETEIHRRLVGMCWKDLPERAEQAAQALARIYGQQGDAEGAKRFAQMAGGREVPVVVSVSPQAARAPAVSPAPLPPLPAQPAASAGVAIELPRPLEQEAPAATPTPSAAPLGSSSEIQEVDLSEDWESFLAQAATGSLAPEAPPEAASFNYEDSRIEVNFYLEHGFLEEAKQAVEDLERTLPSDPRIAELRALVETQTGALAVEGPEKQPAEVLKPTTPLEAAVLPAEEVVEQQEVVSSSAAPEPETQPEAAPPISPREDEIPTEATPGASVEAQTGLLGELVEAFEPAVGELEELSPEPAPPSALTAEPATTREEETPMEPVPSVSAEAPTEPLGELAEAFEPAGAVLQESSPLPAPPAEPTAEPATTREEEIPMEPVPGVSVEAPANLFGDLAEAFEPAGAGLVELSPEPAPPAVLTPEAASMREEEIPMEPVPSVSVEAPANLFGDLAEASEPVKAGLEEPSPLLATPSAPTAEPTIEFAAPAPAPASPLSWPLEEMAEAPATEPVHEDDPETHYYLGVAFWEMHLLDEAIGEFQKVVRGAGKGNYPPNFLQACTLLALCFKDKGMAPIAAKWYCRALETPDLDEEAWLALQYDLGVTYEQAGDLPRALERFSEVYGQNIDFRDVAEKIRTFQQKGS